MAEGLCSRVGCWTCRLRRKKCDELRPECATCEGLRITCHGYGQRPEWLDGGEKEKAAAEIRRQIKNSARRECPPTSSRDRSELSNSNIHSRRQSPGSWFCEVLSRHFELRDQGDHGGLLRHFSQQTKDDFSAPRRGSLVCHATHCTDHSYHIFSDWISKSCRPFWIILLYSAVAMEDAHFLSPPWRIHLPSPQNDKWHITFTKIR